METKSKKAIIYYRVSTEDQAQFGVSLEQQKNNCLAYAEREGWEVVKSFHDDGVSAKTVERPSLQAMLQYCNKNFKQIGYVIIYKVDRLSRNVNDYSNILFLLNKLQIKLVSTTEAIDDTPIGKFVGNIMAANAQMDNEIKGQRVSACMLEKLKQGVWCWHAPFGYKNARDEFNRKIISIDEKRREPIKYIFDQFSLGLRPLESIRIQLNDEGFKTWKGKPISVQMMSKIIKNKFYIGIMTVAGVEYEGTHERLIDEEVFYKCQAILNKGNRADNISRSRVSEDFPLKHFVVCAYCGRPMTAYYATGRWGGKYPYYRCYNNDCHSRKSISKKQMDEDFVKYLKSVIPKDKFLKTFKAVILDVWENKYKEINRSGKNIQEQINSLKEEKIRLIDMKKKDLLPDEDFKEAFVRLNNDITAKQTKLSEAKLEEFDIDEAIDYVFDFIKILPNYWNDKNTTYEQRIKIQGLVFVEKPTYDHFIFQTPKFCPILQTKEDLAQAKSSIVVPRGVEPLLPG
jgi:site-specific DNA recombinase